MGAANPKENIMRWHNRSQSTPKDFKWAQENILKIPELDSEWQKYKTQYTQLQDIPLQSMDSATKAGFKQIKKLFKTSLKKQNLLSGFKLYKQQETLWSDDKNGKCIKLREKDWLENLKSATGLSTEDRKAARQKFKTLVQEACKDVEYDMPFANGGCMDKLADNYADLMGDFKQFLSNRDDPIVQKMATGILDGYETMTKCLEGEFEKKAPTCKEYIEKELNLKDTDVRKLLDQSDPLQKAVKIGVVWNRLGKVMHKVNDQDFWLNAPEDCKVSQGLEKAEVIKQFQDQFQDEVKFIG